MSSNLETRQKVFEDKLRKLQSTVDSMNLQSGFVYVCVNSAWPDVCKIGCTKQPLQRIKGYGTYDPYDSYRLVGYRVSSDMRKDEKDIHKLLSKFRLNGEWFSIPWQEAVGIIHRPDKIEEILGTTKSTDVINEYKMLKITKSTK